MSNLKHQNLYQQGQYELHREYLASLSEHRPCDPSIAASYRKVLQDLPRQETYRLREFPDSCVIITNCGIKVEFPKALFHPAFNLVERVVSNGELQSWLEYLEE